MKRQLVWLSMVCVALFSLTAHAEMLDYSRANRDILVGTWKGEMNGEKKCQGECRGGRVVWQSKVTLVVKEPTRGKFTLHKKNRSWKTDITGKNGSPWMTFAREQREFELSNQGGAYQLRLEFESTAKGDQRNNTLVLIKQ